MITVTTDKLARQGTFGVERYWTDRLIVVIDKGSHLELLYARQKPTFWQEMKRMWTNAPLFIRETVYGYTGPAPEATRNLGIRFVNRAAGLNWFVRA